MFFKGSRYANVPTAIMREATGRVISFKTVRFIGPARASVGHRVVQGDRLDRLAHRYYQDPERFWRICDANVVMTPTDLLVEGRIVRIPASED
jgi:nucleoid-associated protein YgaU